MEISINAEKNGKFVIEFKNRSNKTYKVRVDDEEMIALADVVSQCAKDILKEKQKVLVDGMLKLDRQQKALFCSIFDDLF